VSERRLLHGVHPVGAVLRAGRCPVYRLLVATGRRGREIEALLAEARRRGVPVQQLEREELGKRVGVRTHQGVAAECGPYPYADLEDLLPQPGVPPPLVLVLDGVEDPQNLGALLRSAEALGATGR